MPRQVKRKSPEVASHDYGAPLRPKPLPFATRRAWNALEKELLAARVLRQDDAGLLLELIDCRAAQYTAAAGRRPEAKARAENIMAQFMARQPQPEAGPVTAPEGAPDAPALPLVKPLGDFLGDVRACRTSFEARRSAASATVCGPEAGFPARAKAYAEGTKDDEGSAGLSLRRACIRFLNDLEHGFERGLWFDTTEAQLVCEFAETYCDIKLMDWQVFVLVNLFGWKRVSGQRRFTECWLSVAKKNGKTAMAAVVALWGLVCDQEKFPDVFAVATKKEQASLVWRDAKRIVGADPELKAYVKRLAGHLEVPDTDGMFTPLSSDEKSMDGLRPSFIVADEVAFWDSRDLWDKICKGTVSRQSPLTFAITTAGKDRYCFAYTKFDLAEKILNGTFADDGTFVCIFSIDPDDDYLNNPACWIKANPSLGVTLQESHLQKTADEVKQDGSGRNAFLQYHMNIWPTKTLNRQGSISSLRWDDCAQLGLIGEGMTPSKAYEMFANLNKDTLCFVGLDVGLVNDMTSIAYAWDHAYLEADEFKDGKKIKEAPEITHKRFLLVEYFMPEDGLLDKERAWRVPLSQWVREKWITLLPGDMVDTRDITKHIMETARIQSIQELGFDKWSALQVGADINASTAVKCVEVPQVPSQLTNPCREFLSDIRRGTLCHFGNPVLTWNALNVIMEESEKTGGIKPEKLSAIEKIDGIQAAINAYHRLLAAPPRYTGRVIVI
jgi:phage terminase large subunit-like protein